MRQSPALERIRAEYIEMPGLRVTLEQAQRLFGLERTQCKALIDVLVNEQFLCVTEREMYARASDGGMARSRSANAKAGVDRPTLAPA